MPLRLRGARRRGESARRRRLQRRRRPRQQPTQSSDGKRIAFLAVAHLRRVRRRGAAQLARHGPGPALSTLLACPRDASHAAARGPRRRHGSGCACARGSRCHTRNAHRLAAVGTPAGSAPGGPGVAAERAGTGTAARPQCTPRGACLLRHSAAGARAHARGAQTPARRRARCSAGGRPFSSPRRAAPAPRRGRGDHVAIASSSAAARRYSTLLHRMRISPRLPANAPSMYSAESAS